ncbi:YtxH domain-containing protein [Halobacillus salinus]|uniref:YtxH domain-containing protein n=1 Tax=Halobacillus salinus TaxID=192814 RepID=UPI0009A82747|nr:YtxH domain-containing protein [Halobacillus salinus]
MKQKKNKLPLAILAGAVIGGAFVLLRDPEERRRLKEQSRTTKDSVSSYAHEAKENPSETKDAFVSKVRRFVSAANEVVTTVQSVYNEHGQEIKDKVKEIKEESEEVVDTAKEAGAELQEAGEKAQEELSETETEAQLPSEDNVVEVPAQQRH